MTLSEKLKSSTQVVHREIESSYYFNRLLSNDLKVEEYLKILCLWKVFLTPIENNWQKNTELTKDFPGIEKRMKICRLNKDIDWLETNYALDKQQIHKDISISTSSDTFHLLNLIATLYVVEGSTMGAMHIVKHLTKFSFCTNESTHFYNQYGMQTKYMWQECKLHIDRWGENHQDMH